MLQAKTKKHQMQSGRYIKLGLQYIAKEQWWVALIALAIIGTGFLLPEYIWWFTSLGAVAYLLYWAFWWVQLFGVTKLEQTAMFFQKMVFVVDNKYLMMQVPGRKQGGRVEAMPIQWNMIKKAWATKDSYVFFMSRGQFIYLPYAVFTSKADLKFTEAVLKRKNLL